MATKWTPELNTLVADRGKTKKGSNEYNVIQNKINKAMGNKTVHSTSATTDTEDSTTTDTNKAKKPYVKPGGKATGKMKNYALGSQERRDEYTARGWKQDSTTVVKDTKSTTPTTTPQEFGTNSYPISMIGSRENENMKNTINNANAPTSLIGGVKTRKETRVANREARTVLKADKWMDKLDKREAKTVLKADKYTDKLENREKRKRTKTITTDSAGTTTKTISKGDKIKKTVERDSSGNKTTRKYKS